MNEKYYVIAEVDKSYPSAPHDSDWPKLIAYSFKSKKLLIQEGKGHGLMGGEIPLERFNKDDWKNIFYLTSSEWFLDLISNGVLQKINDEKDFIKTLRNKRDIRIINY